MTTNPKKAVSSAPTPTSSAAQNEAAPECCDCLALSPLQKSLRSVESELAQEDTMLVSTNINTHLRSHLQTLLPACASLSIFLLHISQWERPLSSHHPPSQQNFHAAPDLLEQVMTNVLRVMRMSDQVLLKELAGAAIIFPDVDQQGASTILERIYHSICLLQAETLLPPLALNTTILMSMNSYPQPATSLDRLLSFTSVPPYRFTLRPAITTSLWHTSPLIAQEVEAPDKHAQKNKGQAVVPFMELPSSIPLRLQHLLPYSLATELRCVPVGRNHHCLTIAMADPTNTEHVRRLHQATTLTIFPVACDPQQLHTLLKKKW